MQGRESGEIRRAGLKYLPKRRRNETEQLYTPYYIKLAGNAATEQGVGLISHSYKGPPGIARGGYGWVTATYQDRST